MSANTFVIVKLVSFAFLVNKGRLGPVWDADANKHS